MKIINNKWVGDAQLYFPLHFIFWFPATLCGIVFLYDFIMWKYFDVVGHILIENKDIDLATALIFIKNAGFLAVFSAVGLLMGYLYLTFMIIIAFKKYHYE